MNRWCTFYPGPCLTFFFHMRGLDFLANHSIILTGCCDVSSVLMWYFTLFLDPLRTLCFLSLSPRLECGLYPFTQPPRAQFLRQPSVWVRRYWWWLFVCLMNEVMRVISAASSRLSWTLLRRFMRRAGRGKFQVLLCTLSAVLNHVLTETRLPSMPLGNHCSAETKWITCSAR